MVVIQLGSISGSATKIPLAQPLGVEAVKKTPESRMEPVPLADAQFMHPVEGRTRLQQNEVKDRPEFPFP